MGGFVCAGCQNRFERWVEVLRHWARKGEGCGRRAFAVEDGSREDDTAS